MKATLTIEVPDDFKKGECRKCMLLNSWINQNYNWCPAMRGAIPMNADYLVIADCPLEIKENNSDRL